MVNLLLEKLPEHFNIDASHARLKKEIIGSLSEIISDKSYSTVVVSLEKILLEDSEFIVPMLDSFSNMNLDEHLQEHVQVLILFCFHVALSFAVAASKIKIKKLNSQLKGVIIALSCIKTMDGENMHYLLKFLLLSTTPVNVGRIISQIPDHLKFVGIVDPCSARCKKLKGKSLADSTEASILNALCLRI